jgi:hypothetical protein
VAPTNEQLHEEALRIVAEAERAGHVVRVIGSVACYARCPSAEEVMRRAGRRFADIDLITSSRLRHDAADQLLSSLGYTPYSHHNVWHAETRQMFDRGDGVHVDLFRDELNFCHPISFRGRLEEEAPTAPLVELALQKLQIVEINEKDLQDLGLLLMDHPLGAEPDQLDGDRIAGVLAGDWGFWYTATTNLGKLSEYVAHAPEVFGGASPAEDIRARAAELERVIEERPKGLQWRMRAKVGTHMRWYQEVEEAER